MVRGDRRGSREHERETGDGGASVVAVEEEARKRHASSGVRRTASARRPWDPLGGVFRTERGGARADRRQQDGERRTCDEERERRGGDACFGPREHRVMSRGALTRGASRSVWHRHSGNVSAFFLGRFLNQILIDVASSRPFVDSSRCLAFPPRAASPQLGGGAPRSNAPAGGRSRAKTSPAASGTTEASAAPSARHARDARNARATRETAAPYVGPPREDAGERLFASFRRARMTRQRHESTAHATVRVRLSAACPRTRSPLSAKASLPASRRSGAR